MSTVDGKANHCQQLLQVAVAAANFLTIAPLPAQSARTVATSLVQAAHSDSSMRQATDCMLYRRLQVLHVWCCMIALSAL